MPEIPLVVSTQLSSGSPEFASHALLIFHTLDYQIMLESLPICMPLSPNVSDIKQPRETVKSTQKLVSQIADGAADEVRLRSIGYPQNIARVITDPSNRKGGGWKDSG